jgi:transaldolase
MTEATLRAFADHGDAGRPFDWTDNTTDETLRLARSAGLDLPKLTADLERAGVAAFCGAYDELIRCIEAKLRPRAS